MEKKSAQGFILVEILVSLLVFSLGVLFLVQTLSSIIQSNQYIRDNYSAMLLIDNLLNRLSLKETIAPCGIQNIQNKNFTWGIDSLTTLEGLKLVILKVNWHSKLRDYSTVFKYQIINLK